MKVKNMPARRLLRQFRALPGSSPNQALTQEQEGQLAVARSTRSKKSRTNRAKVTL